ncbi:MAG TPA: hypothetical protein VE843_05195 [Ktedonobacteraceae bacterium]|nr:hypothetical protein [Ktedonobacteraceae bacterium]
MCLSCGCGKPEDDHGDSRNITMSDLDRAAEAAGTTREKVVQNIMSGSGNQQGTNVNSSPDQFPQSNADSSGSFLPADQPERRPGHYAQQLGTESGNAWQESQQMGETGLGGVQKPNEG